MSSPLTEAAGILVNRSVSVSTFSPVVLPVPRRAVDLPVILLSHGHGPSNFVSSLYGYDPLADFWAAHGFVVIQPKKPPYLVRRQAPAGGISAYDARETTDENPDHVAALRGLVWAYLRSELYPGDASWTVAIAAQNSMSTPMGIVESK